VDDRFVIGVVADFGSARAAAPSFRRVDCDSFARVLAQAGVVVDVPVLGASKALRIASLGDFHPDALRRLFPAAAAGTRGTAVAPPAPKAPAGGVGSGLLDRVLDATKEEPSQVTPALEELVRRAAEPSLVRGAAPVPETPAALSDALRGVLRAPRFQVIEASWRALHGLVTAVETGPALEIRILDATAAEAAQRLEAALADASAPTPSVLVCGYAFGPSDEEMARLAALAGVAERAGRLLVADGRPALLGVPDAPALATADVRARLGHGPGLERWHAFRRNPLASSVALCLPRVLLRAPYGRAGEPAAAGFEEGSTLTEHESFLWGSAALALGQVIGRAFAAEGPDFDLAAHAELTGLPLHVESAGGESSVLPCAEVVMSDATIAAVVDEGVVVLASVRDEDRASFYGIGTVAGTPLPPLG
jgi:type VI secretion system (T6SS) tail sheath-like EvpB family protein